MDNSETSSAIRKSIMRKGWNTGLALVFERFEQLPDEVYAENGWFVGDADDFDFKSIAAREGR